MESYRKTEPLGMYTSTWTPITKTSFARAIPPMDSIMPLELIQATVCSYAKSVAWIRKKKIIKKRGAKTAKRKGWKQSVNMYASHKPQTQLTILPIQWTHSLET